MCNAVRCANSSRAESLSVATGAQDSVNVCCIHAFSRGTFNKLVKIQAKTYKTSVLGWHSWQCV